LLVKIVLRTIAGHLELASLIHAIAATGINHGALFRRCADAATVAAESCTAAFGLALVVREGQQVIVINSYGRARERNIGMILAELLARRRDIYAQVQVIVGANGRCLKV